jgi:hypothetical protein
MREAMHKTYRMASSSQEALAEARLWQAVIVNTVQDWISGPLRLKREAERYLFGQHSDFALVCQSAGMDVRRLRERLVRLREQRINANCPAAAQTFAA